MSTVKVPTWYYQHFDADFSLDVPAEGFGGWKKTELDISLEHTALAVMHAWDCGTREEYPGLHRMVEYIPRAEEISYKVIPDILNAFRKNNMNIFHIADGSGYHLKYPSYKITKSLEIEEKKADKHIKTDDTLEKLRKFKRENVNPGKNNIYDIQKALEIRDFHPNLRPQNDEPIANDTEELFALCRAKDINHIIYTGFAIDCCLLMSPAGMIDMSRRGVMCSAVRQAVTAVENKETAREETVKEIALWRVGLFFGFVYDDVDLINALMKNK